MQEFDTKELDKLPPGARLAKIKELKAKIQQELEDEAKTLEEESKEEMLRTSRELEDLLHRRETEEKEDHQQRIKEASALEETIAKEKIEEEKKGPIEYNLKPQGSYDKQPDPTGPGHYESGSAYRKDVGPESIGPKTIGHYNTK